MTGSFRRGGKKKVRKNLKGTELVGRRKPRGSRGRNVGLVFELLSGVKRHSFKGQTPRMAQRKRAGTSLRGLKGKTQLLHKKGKIGGG